MVYDAWSGTGLGLPIALGVARAHGGNIELLADAGCRGAEFVLTLPFATEEIREELDLYENREKERRMSRLCRSWWLKTMPI